MTMKFIIHRGTKEIGGSCVEIIGKNTRILLDFGMPLGDGKGGDFNEKALQGKSISELIAAKILYPIEGLYRDAQPSIQAILISHSHKDHYGFLGYAHPDIPLYMSQGASALIEVLNVFVRQDGQLQLSPTTKPVHNQESFEIGDLRITPYLVDHSAFDAMSYHVVEKSSGQSIFYSGDFRAAGWKEKLFDRFVRNPPKDVGALLMEGTMLGREAGKYPDEQAVLDRVIEIVKDSPNKVIFACCSGQNIDRIVTFCKAANRTKSRLIIDPYTACVLNAIKTPRNTIPQMDWDNIQVFIANYFGKGDIYVNKVNHSNLKRLLPMLGRAKIKPKDFTTLPCKAIVLMRGTMIPALEKIPDIQGSSLIYSQWHKYLERDTSDAHRVNSFINRYGLQLEHVHTSGHATLDKLEQLADAVKAKAVFPIHTMEKANYAAHFSNVIELADGEVFDVGMLK